MATKKPARKRKAPSKKAGKPTSARRAVNIKVNVVSKNPIGFRVGDRVQAHPATDTFMRGDRYGTVSKVGKKIVYVKMDRSGRTIKFSDKNLLDANPKRKRRRRKARSPIGTAHRIMRRNRAKMKFIVCATTRKGKKYYWDGAAFKSGKAGLAGAKRFPKFDAATRQAHSLLKRAAPAVASISVEKA